MSPSDTMSSTDGYDLEEKTTGFDASPYLGREKSRGTRILDPRSPLTQITSSSNHGPFFYHALSHQKTEVDVIVDFDGLRDPYRPLNWPARKKIITVLLYGLTTMCSSWGTSMYPAQANILP
jgi:hypothetical protein